MLSSRVLNLQPSATLAVDAKVKLLEQKGIPIINLSLGEPDFATPQNIKKAAKRALDEGFTHYTPSAGILSLREAIVKKLAQDNNIFYKPSEIVVGVGTKQLLYAAFQTICQQGDEVIIPTPTWSTYIEQVKLAGAKVKLVKLPPPFKLTAKTLEPFINKKTKAIVLNSPANPTGATIEKEELEKIAKLALKNNIFIISDEIYEKILYGVDHFSIASINELPRSKLTGYLCSSCPSSNRAVNCSVLCKNKKIKDLTITINGFSKAYAMTGWRIGYATSNQEIINGMVALAGQTTSGTSSISQKGAVEALEGNQDSIKKMLEEFKKRRQFICKEFASVKDISFTPPEGAFYLFLDISRILGKKYKTSAEWAEGLLDQKQIAIVPGEAFCAPGFVRISFASSMENLKKGIAEIKEFIQKQ